MKLISLFPAILVALHITPSLSAPISTPSGSDLAKRQDSTTAQGDSTSQQVAGQPQINSADQSQGGSSVTPAVTDTGNPTIANGGSTTGGTAGNTTGTSGGALTGDHVGGTGGIQAGKARVTTTGANGQNNGQNNSGTGNGLGNGGSNGGNGNGFGSSGSRQSSGTGANGQHGSGTGNGLGNGGSSGGGNGNGVGNGSGYPGLDALVSEVESFVSGAQTGGGVGE